MSQEGELERLEGFVSKLLEGFQDLRTENNRLIQELRLRNETIEDLREQLASGDTERGEISKRVNLIIEQIEEWETSLETAARQEDVSSNDQSRQGDLFSINANTEDRDDEPYKL